MFEDPFGEPGDRGVSEVLAFILVFTIILASVTVVSVFGVQSLTSFQEGEQVRNAERAFDALSDNFNDVVRYDGITDRSGELNLRGGSLSIDQEGTGITISDGDPNNNPEFEHSIETGGLVYQADDRSDSIHYEGGAIFRNADQGEVVVEDPMITCGETAVISLLVIEGDEGRFIGSSVNQVSISEVESVRETHPIDNELTVTIDEESELEPAWERALDDAGFDEDGVCDDADRVTIHIVTAEVDF